MGHRHHKFNMSAALTTHLLLCHLNTTTVADNAFVTNTLVFSTGTLVVLGRTEDLFTEETVALGLVCTIVDGFGLGDLTIRIFLDLFRRSETDGNLRKISLYLCIFFESHISN